MAWKRSQLFYPNVNSRYDIDNKTQIIHISVRIRLDICSVIASEYHIWNHTYNCMICTSPSLQVRFLSAPIIMLVISCGNIVIIEGSCAFPSCKNPDYPTLMNAKDRKKQVLWGICFVNIIQSMLLGGSKGVNQSNLYWPHTASLEAKQTVGQ